MQAPISAAAISGGCEADRSFPDSCSCRAEKMKIANAEIAATPASRPSRPSMKFIAFVSTTVSSTVRTIACVWSSETRLPPVGPLPGSQSTCHCTPKSTSTPAATICPASLAIGVQVEPVVDDPDQADQPAGDQHADDLGRRHERAAQGGELHRHQHGRRETGVDGHPAHPRDGQRVHVPVADGSDRADAGGEDAHDAGQQERQHQGGSEHQRVLARR